MVAHYHLEVHTYDAKTDEPKVSPPNDIKIAVTSASRMKMDMPIAVMFSIKAGPTDIHYGNSA